MDRPARVVAPTTELRPRPGPPSHRDIERQNDTRWLLAVAGAFAVSIFLLAAMYGVYRLTGPHPQVRMFLRTLRMYSRWLLPGI